MRRVLVDANIFVSSWTTDVLMSLAEAGFFTPVWSEAIMDEFRKAACGLGRDELATRLFNTLNHHFPLATIKGWEELLDDMVLPDEGDRHVIAAAMKGACEYIVTFNTRDFPQEGMAELDLVVVHPDELLMELVRERPLGVLEVVQSLVFSKSRPRRTYDEEIEGLRRCGLVEFARWLDG